MMAVVLTMTSVRMASIATTHKYFGLILERSSSMCS